MGVGAVYAGDQARSFIRRWIEQIEGLVLEMESWVGSVRERSIEEMERTLPRPHGMREHNPVCPQCESENTVPILWGYPSPETMEEFEQSMEQGIPPPYALGGRVVEPDSPIWHCNECGHQWGHRDIV